MNGKPEKRWFVAVTGPSAEGGNGLLMARGKGTMISAAGKEKEEGRRDLERGPGP